MRKNIIFLFLLTSFVFTGCFFINNSGNSDDNDPSSENQPQNNDVYSYNLYNDSDYTIDVYYEPEREDSKIISIESKTSKKVEVKKSLLNSLNELVLYYVYHFDFGADFPWYDASSAFYVVTFTEQNVDVTVKNPEKNESRNSFVIIENKSDNTFYFMQGTSVELGSIDSQKSKGFVISELSRDNLSRYIVKSFDGKQSIKLDTVIPVTKLNKGTIYTILISKNIDQENSAVLKSITPFNLDTQKKIWAFDNQTFSTDYSICMRPSLEKKSTYVMGTRVDDVTNIGYIKINEYGIYTEDENNFFSYQTGETSADTILESEVIDFIEQSEGNGNSTIISITRLISTPKTNVVNGNLRDDSDWKEFYIISSYDCQNHSLKWQKQIQSVLFRNDSKNKICAVDKDKIVVTGAYLDSNNQIHYCLIYVDGSQESVVDLQIISEKSDDFEQSKERILTSAYYDGNDVYFCGYENWDSASYSTTHSGKIWKISPEVLLDADNSLFNNNVVYSENNCLFFSIDGTDSDFVVCGEYTDTGKILKGCFVTKSMVEATDSAANKPVLYIESGKAYCWYNQVCMYDDKIVLCGKASSKMDGSEKPVSFVVAYDNNQKKLWNVTYDYSDALNIIPNTIGTFLLQLQGNNNTIHYVNADLLGNEKYTK